MGLWLCSEPWPKVGAVQEGTEGYIRPGLKSHLEPCCILQLETRKCEWSGVDRPRTLVGQLLASLTRSLPSRTFSSSTKPGPTVRSTSFGLSSPTVGAQSGVYLGLSAGPLTVFHFWRHIWQSCTVFLFFFFKLQMLKILPAFELPRGAPHLQPPCAVAMTTSPSL